MELFIASIIGGMLTILAPCILPVLPLIVRGAADKNDRYPRRPMIIIGSLLVSVVAFTLLLRASTVLIDVPTQFWRSLSGVIIVLFGVTYIWPGTWDKLLVRLGLSASSNKLLFKASQRKGIWGDILIGAALGPVFTSCSPTYGLILATVLPVAYLQGVVYLIAYALGLGVMLLAVTYLGNKIIAKLNWATDPNSKFRRALGAIFLIVGLAIILGWDQEIQKWLVGSGIYDPISDLEHSLTQ